MKLSLIINLKTEMKLDINLTNSIISEALVMDSDQELEIHSPTEEHNEPAEPIIASQTDMLSNDITELLNNINRFLNDIEPTSQNTPITDEGVVNLAGDFDNESLEPTDPPTEFSNGDYEINWTNAGPVIQRHVDDLCKLHHLNNAVSSVLERVQTVVEQRSTLLGDIASSTAGNEVDDEEYILRHDSQLSEVLNETTRAVLTLADENFSLDDDAINAVQIVSDEEPTHDETTEKQDEPEKINKE